MSSGIAHCGVYRDSADRKERYPLLIERKGVKIALLNYTLAHYGSIILFFMAMLVFATNIIVELVKGLFPKVPTNFMAVIVAQVLTDLSAVILCTVMEITVMWYYAVGAVVLGLFVGYAAMFGFDKFKAAWEKLKALKK